jgi:hypothetical protein
VLTGPFYLTGFGGTVSIMNMENSRGNKGLLDKKRFEQWDKQRKRRLRGLSWKKAIQLEEQMLSSKLVLEWRDNFSKDKPVCLKECLRNKRRKR